MTRIETIKQRLRTVNYPTDQMRKDLGWVLWLLEQQGLYSVLVESTRLLTFTICDICDKPFSTDPRTLADPCILADHIEAHEAIVEARKRF